MGSYAFFAQKFAKSPTFSGEFVLFINGELFVSRCESRLNDEVFICGVCECCKCLCLSVVYVSVVNVCVYL